MSLTVESLLVDQFPGYFYSVGVLTSVKNGPLCLSGFFWWVFLAG